MFTSEILRGYNELEMMVYNYIIEHKQEIQYMTIRELAEAVHVSTSTIMRFCRKTGFDGYSEFKVQFKLFLKKEQQKRIPVPKDGGTDELMYFFHMVTSNKYEAAIHEAAQAISQARRLIFIGIGTSGILGKYGARYFSNIGKYSQYIEDPYYPIEEDLTSAIVIALSESGETKQILKFVERFKRHKAKILSITNGSSCTLAGMSDYNLAYYVTRHLIRGEYNITTQVPVVYLLETIGRRLDSLS